MIGSKTIFLPSKTLVYIISTLKFKPTHALDLGCGAGRDSIYMANNGISIDCVDKSKSDVEILKNKLNSNKNAKIYVRKIQDFKFKKYDLVNAQWSLPFLPKADFDNTLLRIQNSLITGGFFTGQFFGVNDEWNNPKHSNMTFLTKKQVKSILSSYSEIQFEEFKEYGYDRENNPKFWHFFEFVVRKV